MSSIISLSREAPSSVPVANDRLGHRLLTLARAAIVGQLNGTPSATQAAGGRTPVVDRLLDAELESPGATFVTLTNGGKLRGCIGSLEANRTLAEDVTANAVSAAFDDYRFTPLTADELADLRVEVSLLGEPERMEFADEDDACAQLQPRRDGVILAVGERRVTFLPQVWDELPDARDFLARLKQKAGFAAEYWSPAIRLWRYRVKRWKESP